MSTVETSALSSDPGWYVEDLVSTLVIGADGARLHERWSVVAELPLDELLLELNLDGVPHPRRAIVDAVGAEVVPDSWPSAPSGRPVVGVRLPKPLGPWETHTFGLMMCLPAADPGTGEGHGAHPRRHVVVPGGPVLRLELRVHFDLPAAPDVVTRLEAGTPGARTPVDRTGDVVAVFPDLRPGLPYGVTW